MCCASDSDANSTRECDEISSGEEFEDLEDIVDVDVEENTSDVPLAGLRCSKEVSGKYKFEKNVPLCHRHYLHVMIHKIVE